MTGTAWHALGVEEVEARLETRAAGLTNGEAAARLTAHGPNALPEPPPARRWVVLVRQLKSPLIFILVLATGITVAIGEFLDAGVIAAVVVVNTIIGYIQERKAESSVRALMKLVSPHAKVIRGGQEWEVPSRELVPGDVVLLESGARVPADLRLLGTAALTVDESLLTGESLPARKSSAPVDDSALVADRSSMAYTGTIVVSGRGRGAVVATGSATELGATAEEMRAEERGRTPLQIRMDQFARVVGVAVAAGAAASFGFGLLLGESASDMFLLAVAVAVSAVPESLPVILTITLAVGVRRMARRNAVVRRLPAVETLGSTTVIGSDKTGTLTENRMTVEEVWCDGRTFSVPGAAADATPSTHHPLHRALEAAVLANEADLFESAEGAQARGDPTEVALLVAGDAFGVAHAEVRELYRPFAEIPFEPEQRYSASVRLRDGRAFTFVKGAPERVLEMCHAMAAGGGEVALDSAGVLEAARDMGARGLRVLAMASREEGAPPAGPEEVGEPHGLVFLGLAGMMDPPRAGVRDAIRGCQSAGVRVVMITGDHADTAQAIGSSLGILREGVPRDVAVVGGQELAAMSDDELTRRVGDAAVFARVAPAGKLRIVRALQRRGEVVAVTGDGVNDAPALKAADIGVAMGKSGTDVAREAADMVLADDNFVSVYAAVEEGRVVFENIRKVTFFLVSTGAAELTVILVSLALGWKIPLLPAQLLWLNLVTNGLLDVALAFEPGEKTVLDRPPRRRAEGIISSLLWQRTVLVGVVMAAGTLFMFHWENARGGTLAQAQAAALTTMVIFQVFHVGNCRSETLSVFQKSPFANRFLLVATLGSLGVHVAALYLPPLQHVLRIAPIFDAWTWLRMVVVAASVLVVTELHKLLTRRRRRAIPAGSTAPARAHRRRPRRRAA